MPDHPKIELCPVDRHAHGSHVGASGLAAGLTSASGNDLNDDPEIMVSGDAPRLAKLAVTLIQRQLKTI